jgi:hydroxymethylglutaryl-CoA reductase
MTSSRVPGFYDLPRSKRLDALSAAAGLDGETAAALSGSAGLAGEQADHMIENVVGVYGLPLGIAVNFVVNGREVFVPMVIEEPSVVAGASFMARLARQGGGFQAETTAPEMIAQLQVLEVPDLAAAREALLAEKAAILAEADQVDPVLLQLRDAMGANAANTAAERLAPRVEAITGGRVHLRILSNLADRRLARATCRIPAAALAFGDFTGERVRDGIVEAWAFAAVDPYRAATHNKGIMNGVDAVVIATGNDWRAIEAGAHAYAARSGRYTSLSQWSKGADGALEGRIEMPMAVGTVGGATRVHPTARACLRLMGVASARELAEVVVSVGLAQNLAALRALATEGIQRGHMGLHARQVAIAAGAQGDQVEWVARQLVIEGTVRLDRAEAILHEREAGGIPPRPQGAR